MQIAPLKKFAINRLQGFSYTQSLILSEPDELPTEEFIIKTKVWLTALQLEARKSA